MSENESLLQALAEIESHPDFRVLRRFRPRQYYNEWRGGRIFRGLFLDLETTSADPKTAEVLEFAGARFTFNADGMIYEVEESYNELEQPSKPIEPMITDINGITDEDVAGKKIDDATIAALMKDVDLVIAYNADFDRRIAERRFPGVFESVRWACAYRQVKWKSYGAVGGKLEHVVTACGLFYEAHRALIDTLVGIHILATPSRVELGDGVEEFLTPMLEILQTTKAGATRVMAHGSAFERKDELKARGFQWRGKVPWFVDMESAEAARAEAQYLIDHGLANAPALVRIGARDRYSVREDAAMYGRGSPEEED